MASIDMLSGLANRRGFQSRLDFEWMKAQQFNSELSLLMIDVDHFKLYNDTYGHPEGDACLTRLGEALAGMAAGTMGFAGRYAATNSACRCRTPVRPRRWRSASGACGRSGPRHASHHLQPPVRHRDVGVAATLPSDAQSPDDLVEAADTPSMPPSTAAATPSSSTVSPS